MESKDEEMRRRFSVKDQRWKINRSMKKRLTGAGFPQ